MSEGREGVMQAVNSLKASGLHDDTAGHDRATVLSDVAEDGDNLQYASDELRADQEVVLKAVAQTGTAMAFASMELRSSRDFMLTAMKTSPAALEFASKDLLQDSGFVLEALHAGYPDWEDVEEGAVQMLADDVLEDIAGRIKKKYVVRVQMPPERSCVRICAGEEDVYGLLASSRFGVLPHESMAVHVGDAAVDWEQKVLDFPGIKLGSLNKVQIKVTGS
mmetsp:Transcript_23030/g.42424  ORF Transcript_23030/g.42424 Transcript_23030/m.42424 type:complete len:221 (-) Transcript_23030:84-746(-)